jgi:hypothetical protein
MHGFSSFEWPAVQIWIFRRNSNKRTKSTNDWKLCYNCPQMIHVGLHSIGIYHKKFGRQNLKNKNLLCRVSREDTRQRSLYAECQPSALDKGWWPSGLGRPLTALCRAPLLPSVLHSVNQLVTESRNSPSAALGKAAFAECPTKGTRQSPGFQ